MLDPAPPTWGRQVPLRRPCWWGGADRPDHARRRLPRSLRAAVKDPRSGDRCPHHL